MDPYRADAATHVRNAELLNAHLDGFVAPGAGATTTLMLALAMRLAEAADAPELLLTSTHKIAASLDTAAYMFFRSKKGGHRESR